MEVHPVDRLIELGLRPVLSHVVHPAGVRSRLDIDLIITEVGTHPAFPDNCREVINQLWSRTVDHTMVMETSNTPTFEDGDHLDSFPMSFEAVTVQPPVQEVGEVPEVTNGFVSVDPMMDRQMFSVGDKRLLERQRDRVRKLKLFEIDERPDGISVIGFEGAMTGSRRYSALLHQTGIREGSGKSSS